MSIQLLFFGATAEIVGYRRRRVEHESEEPINKFLEQLICQHPRLGEHKLRFSVNQEFAASDQIVRDGDELAIFTGVSGG